MAVFLIVVVIVVVDGAEAVEGFELLAVLDVGFEGCGDRGLLSFVLANLAGFFDEVFFDFEMGGRGWVPLVWSMAWIGFCGRGYGGPSALGVLIWAGYPGRCPGLG